MSTVRKVYAFRNRKDVLEKSSSGGAFTAIYEAIFSSFTGKVSVYGAVFDSAFKVVHQKARNIQECNKFRGSKYVQSDMSGIYPEIQKDLENGDTVLFSGTPCQIYSVKSFCKKKEINTEKLYLIDVICHGTVSPFVWEDFVLWLEKKYGSKLNEFQFRYKKSRWKSYPVMAHFENGKSLINTLDVRLYTELYLTALPLIEKCYCCRFANLDRQSDLSIGDFWGIQKVMPSFPKGDGTSEILVNTEKGEHLMQIIKQQTDVLIEECHSDGYIKYQHNLCNPTSKPKAFDQFQKDYREKGFEYVLRVYGGNTAIGRLKHRIKKFCRESEVIDRMRLLCVTLK